MHFIPFAETNKALTAPAGLEESVGTLPVYNDGNQSVSCWMPSQQEREAIAAGLPIWVGVQAGHSQPPIWVCALKPPMPPVQLAHELLLEIEDALQQFAQRLPDPSFAGKAPERGDALRRLNPDLRQYHDGRRLDLGQLYFVSSDEIQQAHLVAMRAAYCQGGKPALVDYLKPYKYFLDAPNALPIA